MSKFTEARLESAIIELLQIEGYGHASGDSINLSEGGVLLREDLHCYLSSRYAAANITKMKSIRLSRS